MKKVLLVAVAMAVWSMLCISVVAEVHHAFLRPAWNPVVGGLQLSRAEIAEAIRTNNLEKYFPGAVDALVRDLAGLGLPIRNRLELASFLVDTRVREIPCEEALNEAGLIPTVWIDDRGRTGPFHRTCYPGETLFAWEKESGIWRAFMSARCGQSVLDLRAVPVALPLTPEPALPTENVPVPPQEDPCVPIPEAVRGWEVAFPYRQDIEAWKGCNPGATCSGKCISWLQEGTDMAAREVLWATDQGKGVYAALERVTMMPRVRHGAAVFCEQVGSKSGNRSVFTNGSVRQGSRKE